MSSSLSSLTEERRHNEADYTYADSGSEPSSPDTTPSKRHQRLDPFSAAAKRRVDVVTGNTGNRCLITNCLPEHAVDYAHLLPRVAKDSELTRLEYVWGMRRGTLNVDTRLNIFRLRKDVHALFDKGGFILLPEGDVLEKYRRGEKPDFDGDRANNVRYNYTLIASTKTDGYPLHRLPFPAAPGESQEAVNFHYPFSSFPILHSHVHPCFVICHIGRLKDQDSYAPRISNGTDLVLRFTRVLAIYRDWKDARPGATFFKNARLPTDRRDPDDGDDTHLDRVEESEYRRSARLQKKNDRQVSPSEGRGGKKRHRFNNQRDCHDDTRHEDSQGLRALKLLKAENRHPHTYKRKREFVRDWVSSVVGQTFVEDDTLVSQESQTFDDKGGVVVKELHHTPHDISVN